MIYYILYIYVFYIYWPKKSSSIIHSKCKVQSGPLTVSCATARAAPLRGFLCFRAKTRWTKFRRSTMCWERHLQISWRANSKGGTFESVRKLLEILENVNANGPIPWFLWLAPFHHNGSEWIFRTPGWSNSILAILETAYDWGWMNQVSKYR